MGNPGVNPARLRRRTDRRADDGGGRQARPLHRRVRRGPLPCRRVRLRRPSRRSGRTRPPTRPSGWSATSWNGAVEPRLRLRHARAHRAWPDRGARRAGGRRVAGRVLERGPRAPRPRRRRDRAHARSIAVATARSRCFVSWSTPGSVLALVRRRPAGWPGWGARGRLLASARRRARAHARARRRLRAPRRARPAGPPRRGGACAPGRRRDVCAPVPGGQLSYALQSRSMSRSTPCALRSCRSTGPCGAVASAAGEELEALLRGEANARTRPRAGGSSGGDPHGAGARQPRPGPAGPRGPGTSSAPRLSAPRPTGPPMQRYEDGRRWLTETATAHQLPAPA